MKKALVLALVFVMALASSVFAANVSGTIGLEISNERADESFKNGFLKGFQAPTLSISLEADGGDVNWSFEGGFAADKVGEEFPNFVLDKYLFKLDDEWIDLYLWGNDYELSDKGTALGLLNAGKAASAANDRVRLVVDAIDPVTLTADYTNDNLFLFVDAKIAGYEAGVAYNRIGSKIDDTFQLDKGTFNTVGLWGRANIDMFTIEADVASTLDAKKTVDGKQTEGLAFAYSGKVTAKVTDEVSLWAQYTGAQPEFKPAKDKGVFVAGAQYQDASLQVKAENTFTIAQDAEKGANKTTLTAYYRFSEKLAYNRLFGATTWYTNDAPAIGATANLKDFKLQDATLQVASPVVEDMVWARARVKYDPIYKDEKNAPSATETSHEFEIGAYGYVKPVEKVIIKPSVEYFTLEDKIDVASSFNYLVGGNNDVVLSLGLKKTFAASKDSSVQQDEIITAGVEISF